jgi:hypothetical protein
MTNSFKLIQFALLKSGDSHTKARFVSKALLRPSLTPPFQASIGTQQMFFAHSAPVSMQLSTAKPQQVHHISVTWVNQVTILLIRKWHHGQKVEIVPLPK